MLEAYHDLFDRYLRVLKKEYDPEKPYENLEECISLCKHFYWKLQGMLALLEEAKYITSETEKMESEKIVHAFSAMRLFGAYKENGEIMVFRTMKSTMPEDPHDF